MIKLLDKGPSFMNETVVKIWFKTLETVLKLPGARIDRSDFLRQELLKKGCKEPEIDNAVSTTPAKAGISQDIIMNISKGCIRDHKYKATLASAFAGMPGGILAWGAVPVDVLQFYWHIVVLIQKLSYLHGWQDLLGDREEIDNEVLGKFTLFIGVMLGMNSAKKGIGIMTEIYTKNALGGLKRLLDSNIAKIIEKIALRLGIKLGREKISNTIGFMIPIVGGTISGAVTYSALGTMGENLRKHLSEQPLAKG